MLGVSNENDLKELEKEVINPEFNPSDRCSRSRNSSETWSNPPDGAGSHAVLLDSQRDRGGLLSSADASRNLHGISASGGLRVSGAALR